MVLCREYRQQMPYPYRRMRFWQMILCHLCENHTSLEIANVYLGFMAESDVRTSYTCIQRIHILFYLLGSNSRKNTENKRVSLGPMADET